MKRVFAILLVLAMVLSMGITAFAEEPVAGSITITNPTAEQEYRLYKFFDATYATAIDEKGEEYVLTDSNGKAIVSYTIETTNQFFDLMFGGDGNNFFEYDEKTGVVKLKNNTLDSEVINYLATLINNEDIQPIDTKTLEEGKDTIVFENLAPGYYLVDRGAQSTVTITTNMPDVEIIDKNQKPNVNDSFDKLIYDEDTKTWVSSTSANIGDVVDFKIEFEATNYDGDKMIEYYVIRDEKDSAFWVEFNDISVTVGNVDLGKGYYFCAGDPSINTGDWTAEKNAEQWAENPEDAGWYLIHYTYDIFEIVIPWVSDSTFIAPTANADHTPNYGMELGENVDSKFDSPISVEVKYSASVGPDAINGTVENSATLSWYSEGQPDGPDDPEKTETAVYNMGIEKVDGSNDEALAGAVFELYKDRNCTQPIYVIPTGEDGVYILDDAMTSVSGENRTTSREKYAGKWEEYIKEDPNPDTTSDQEEDILKYNKRNDMTTPASGKLVVLGLEANTYFLKETKAPDGYNQLSDPQEVIVGSGSEKDTYGLYEVYTVTVINNRGTELPSTGGEGTMMMITFGSLIAMGFAILLITQKKMSVYRD